MALRPEVTWRFYGVVVVVAVAVVVVVVFSHIHLF